MLVNFLIDDVFIDNVIVSSLQSGEQVEVSFYWSQKAIGRYEIQIEVELVPGEEYLLNNVKTKHISVIDTRPVKACVLDGFITDFYTLLNRPI